MLAIRSDIAKYHYLFTQGAVAFQTPGLILIHPVVLLLEIFVYHLFTYLVIVFLFQFIYVDDI